MKTNNRGRDKAKEILEDIGFDEIIDISNADLVSGFGAIYICEHLDNADGKIIRGKSRTIIKVNSSIPYSSKIRFTVAHELGHFFLHKKLEVHSDNSKTLSWFNIENQAKRGIQEYEANDFASELLMPENVFRKEIEGQYFTPKLVKDLANRFNTSLTSTLFRMIKLNTHSIFIAFILNGTVLYWKKSESFKVWVKDINRLSPPEDSVAKEYIDSGYEFIYSGKDKKQEISRSTWFRMNDRDEDDPFYEYCIPTKSYKTLLSVVWED